MQRPALPQRASRTIPLLAAVAAVVVVAAVTIVVLVRRGDGDTIVDPWPADPPATERDPHVVASIESGGGEGPAGSTLVFELLDDGSVFASADDAPFGVDRYRLTDEGVERARRCSPASSSANRLAPGSPATGSLGICL